jgi:hypothetical protein
LLQSRKGTKILEIAIEIDIAIEIAIEKSFITIVISN